MNRRRMLRSMMACLLAVVVTAGSLPTELLTRQVYAAAVEDGDITAVYEDSLDTADAVAEESLSAEQDSSEAVNPEEIGSTDIVESDGDSLELAEGESLTEDGNALIDEELGEELTDVKDDALSEETTADEAMSELIDTGEGDIVNAEGEGSSTGAGNALKAIGIDTDKMPEGYDDEDDYANPYGRQNVTWGGSDEVFVATMGKSGSTIIGNNYAQKVGKKNPLNTITYRNGTGYHTDGQGVYDEFITDLAVEAAVKGEPAEKAQDEMLALGYTVIDKDLNEGNSGSRLYLGYKTSRDAKEAITDIKLVKVYNKSSGGEISAPNEITSNGIKYKKVGKFGLGYWGGMGVIGELNTGVTNSQFGLFLYYTKDKTNWDQYATAVMKLTIDNNSSNSSDTSMVTVGGFTDSNPDTNYSVANANEGAGGNQVYIHMRKEDIRIADVEGSLSDAANPEVLQSNFMNKTAGGSFDGKGDGKRSQYAMVSVDPAGQGKMYLSVVDANNQHESKSKELGWRVSGAVNNMRNDSNNWYLAQKWNSEFLNQYQATSYMNVLTGDFNDNGIDEIVVYNPYKTSTGSAAVEIYSLKYSPDKCDIYDMDNWEISQTIGISGDLFVSMDVGDLNGDYIDDLVIGHDRDVNVYHGSRTKMLEDPILIDGIPRSHHKYYNEFQLVDPSVAIIHDNGNQYLCIMVREDAYLFSNAYFYICSYDLNCDGEGNAGYKKTDKCDDFETQWNNTGAKKINNIVQTPRLTSRWPLNLFYANGRIMSPCFDGYAFKFNDGNMQLVECPDYSLMSTNWHDINHQFHPIGYDCQVADLNGDGNQTVFFKLFIYDWADGTVNQVNHILGKDPTTRLGHYLGAFSPFVADGPSMYPNIVCDPGNSPVYAVVNTDNDTSCIHYTGKHHVEYSDPVVLAVLSSPPYFKDLATASGLEGEYAESSTSYGSSHGSGSSTSKSKTLSAGVYVSVEVSVNIFGWEPIKAETEIEEETSFTNEYENSSSIDYTVEYSTSSGTDAVVFYSFPTEVYEYVTTYYDKAEKKTYTYTRTLNFPRNPCITTIDLDKYNSIAQNYDELPTIDGKILDHKLGYPETYPTRAGNYANERVFDGEWMGVGKGGSITQSQSIEMSKETESSYECAVAISRKVGAGGDNVVFGVSTGLETSGGYANSSTSGSSFGAEIANLPDYAEDYGYGFSWKLYTHEGSYLRNGQKVRFPVVDYLVSDVVRPPSIPENLSQDYDKSTENSIALEWEYDDPTKADKFNIYRTISIGGVESTVLAGTVQTGGGVINGRGMYVFTYTDDGRNKDGTKTTLNPGMEYDYFIEAERSPYNPPSLSVPSEKITAYTHSKVEYPNITVTGISGNMFTAYPDHVYTIEADVTNKDKFQQVSYKWQKFSPKKGWTDVSKNKYVLEIDDATAQDAGEYRFRVDAIFYNEQLQKLSPVSAYSDIITIDFAMRSVALEALNVECDSSNKPVGEVTLKPSDAECFVAPSGDVKFIIEGEQTLVTYDATLVKGEGNKATATLPDDAEALPQGNYKLSVFYEGDTVFGSFTSDEVSIIAGEDAIYPVLTNEDGKRTNKFVYGDVMHIDFYSYTKDGSGRTIETKLTDNTNTGGYCEMLKKTPGDYNDQEITVNLEGEGVKTFKYSYTLAKRPITVGVKYEELHVGDVEDKLPVKKLKEDSTLAVDDTLDEIVNLEFRSTANGPSKPINNSSDAGTYYAVLVPTTNEKVGCYDLDLNSTKFKILPKVYALNLLTEECEGNPAGTISMTKPEKVGSITNATRYYQNATKITLTAKPFMGYKFHHWEIKEGDEIKDPVNVDSIEITMSPVETTIKAVFAPHRFKVTVDYSLSEGGEVMLPDGFINGGEYPVGKELTFIAIENVKYIPDHWIRLEDKKTYNVNGAVLKLKVPESDVTLYPVFKENTANPHKHYYVLTEVKSPTCTQKGSRTYTCACKDFYIEEVAALGHDYKSEITKEPTTTAEGVRTFTCTRCGDSYTEEIEKLNGTFVLYEKVKSDEKLCISKKLNVGAGLTLITKFESGKVVNERVVWASTNPEVATVTQGGKVKALSSGETKIIVKSEENPSLSAYCYITVAEPVTEVSLDNKKGTLGTGESMTVTASVLPFTAKQELKWTANNDNVSITVSPDTLRAEIFGAKAGSAKVTAEATDGSGKKAICSVTVGNPVPDFTIAGKGSKTEVVAGKTLAMLVDWGNTKPKNAAVTWTVSGENASYIASISDKGVLTGLTAGKVTVTATSKANANKKASTEITITKPAENNKPKVTGITFSKVETLSKNGLCAGKSFKIRTDLTLSAKGSADSNAVAWISSDATVATVSQKGVVKGVGPGSVTITAITRDAANLESAPKATITFKVYSVVKSVKLDKKKLTVGTQDGTRYGKVSVASVIPANATDPSIEWSANSGNVQLAAIPKEASPSTGIFAEAGTKVTTKDGEAIAIKALAPGSVKLTGITNDGSKKKVTCTITIRGHVTSFTLKTQAAKNGVNDITLGTVSGNTATYKSTMKANSSLKVTPVFEINGVSNTGSDKKTYASYKKYTDLSMSYRSSDTKVATVDKNGKIKVQKKAESGKTATIYGVTADGLRSVEVLVTVK